MDRISAGHLTVEKRQVFVRVVFLKIGVIDTVEERYSATVSIESKWEEPLLRNQELPPDDTLYNYWNPHIYVANAFTDARKKHMRKVGMHEDGRVFMYQYLLLIGNIRANMFIPDFPFDIQELMLIIKSKTSSADTILLDDVDDIHRINTRLFIDKRRFSLYKFVGSKHPIEFTKTRDGYPTLIVYCVSARRWQIAVSNLFGMTFVLGLMTFLSLVIDIRFISKRFHVIILVFMSTVIFKYAIVLQLPRISQVTCVETYYYFCQIYEILAFYYHASLSRVNKSHQMWLDAVAVFLFVFCYMIFNIIFLVYIIFWHCSNRRRMNKLQKEYEKRLSDVLDYREMRRQLQAVEHFRTDIF